MYGDSCIKNLNACSLREIENFCLTTLKLLFVCKFPKISGYACCFIQIDLAGGKGFFFGKTEIGWVNEIVF